MDPQKYSENRSISLLLKATCALISPPPTHTHTPTQARDIYEESIQTVTTVRDFGQVFDAYAQFEESMINSKMETTADMGASDDGRWRE